MSANLAIWNMHAKYQLIQAIHLARAMGVVRNSPQHLIIGGFLYILFSFLGECDILNKI